MSPFDASESPAPVRRPLMFAARKVTGLRRRIQMLEAKLFNARHAPELGVAYGAFAREAQISSPRQPRKGRDLWRLLETERPTNIVELGSGTTSAVFALWASRHAARYVAFEHNPGWAKVTQKCLNEASLLGAQPPVQVVPTRVADGEQSIGFTQLVPLDVDFVYVDGPPCVLASGRKVPNDDVVRLFDAGGRPRAIVVDGRFDTVDLIRRHAVGQMYDFRPGFDYGMQHGLLGGVLRGREHSVFRLVRPIVTA